MSPYKHCFRFIGIVIFIIASFSSSQTKTIIHIKHPWADNAARTIHPPFIISSETGYYPGTPMNSEGGYWYTYTLNKINRTTNERIEFASYIPDQYNEYNNPERYPSGQQLILLTIFSGSSEDINEIWIIPSVGGGAPKILFTPPKDGKVISILNPWDLGAPRVIVNNNGIVPMRPDARSERCGWFIYNYFGETDSINVLFLNSLDSTYYGLNGIGNTKRIILTDLLLTSDSVWIYRASPNDTANSVASAYPNIIGDCNKTIHLAALMRDIGIHPDFGIYQELAAENCGGWQPGMVEKKLGSDGKPVKKAHQCKMIHSQFDWFDTQTFPNGYTNETCYDLTLTKNEEGLFAFETDSFYPLDDFVYLDAEQTIRNPNNNLYIDPYNKPPFNVHFTMELSAQFDYHKGQTFYFRGDDDVWVFIDSQLAVDLGGDHGPIEGSVNLDTLGLTPGATYSFKLFFVERNCCGSNFLMQTSLNLRTENRLFTVMTIPEPGKIQFNFFERISHNSLACDASEMDIDTIDAKAQFFIEGPQFTTPQELPSGLSYDGIFISEQKNIITVDTASITGLAAGNYLITAYLVADPSQSSKIPFTVSQTTLRIIQNPVISAAYFTDNGKGQVTRAEIYYTNPLVRQPDSVVLFWPEPFQNNRRCASGVSELFLDSLNATHLTVHLSVPFDTITTRNKGTTQLGTSYQSDTLNAGLRDIVRFDIADSVGPLLTYALYPERKASHGNDTLLLTFSERIIDSLVTGDALIFKKKDGSESIVSVLSYAQRLDTLVVITEPFSTLPSYGDSIRIAAQGPVTDLFGNHAHPRNRPVPLVIKQAIGEVITSYYSDRNADGIIDRATFCFDRPVLLDNCSFSLSWLSSIIAPSIPGNALHYNNNDSTIVILELAQAFPKPLSPRTWGMMTYNLVYKNISSPEIQQNGTVADSAAPVVMEASYHPAIFSSKTASVIPDTIFLQLSEEIVPSGQPSPFQLKKPGTTVSFSPELQLLWQKDTILAYLVNTPIPDTWYPEDNDSVYINTKACISDVSGSIQLNPDNHRALLDYFEIEPHFRIVGGPNPFNPSVEKFYFVLRSDTRSRNARHFTIQEKIYDKTGSVVYESTWSDPPAAEAFSFMLPWDGTNKKGRFVGSGTYLAIITVFDLNNGGKRIIPDNREPLFIGVKKGN